MDFNRDWLFSDGKRQERTVNLPHDAMLWEKRDPACHNGDRTGFYPGGCYRYKKSFSLTEEESLQDVRLAFEGVYGRTTVYMNGQEVARHAYGYTGFRVVLSGKVRAGENVVEVQVDNHLEPNSRWYTGSGIYRPVHLEIAPQNHIEKVQIRTLQYEPPVIRVDVFPAETEAEIEILDGSDLMFRGEPGEIPLPEGQLWSAEHPRLYTCVVKTGAEVLQKKFGIRLIQWGPDTGLLVNGKEVLLRGGCIHHDHGVLGACAFGDAERRRARILKEAGYNAVRSAHNPCSEAFLEACDDLGLYVMDEAFDGWYIPKTHHDYARDFEKQYKTDLLEMVERDFNHPSVIMYSIGNEVTETALPKGIALTEEMVKLAHEADDTRPVTCGINPTLNVMAASGKGLYKDEGEYTPEPLPPKDGKEKKQESGSALFNAIQQRLNWLTRKMAASKKADLAIREAAEKLDVLGLNYGGTRYDMDVVQYPQRMVVGSESLIDELPYNWERVKKYKQVIGDFAWTAWDYLGEAGIGDWTYFSRPGELVLAGCGAIDLTGHPGTENAFQQIVWGLRSVPFIGIRPLSMGREMPKKSRWRFTDAIDSWSWEGHEGEKAVAEIYSNAYGIGLYLNGKKVAGKLVKNYKAVFTLPYQPGTLVAVAFDEQGKETGRSSLQTAGPETQLTLMPEIPVLQANGQDLCFISISLTDGQGIVKPGQEDQLTITLDGPGTLQGCGSACAKTTDIFVNGQCTTYYGRALAVVRAGYEKGSISVKVEGKQFGEAACVIEIQ